VVPLVDTVSPRPEPEVRVSYSRHAQERSHPACHRTARRSRPQPQEAPRPDGGAAPVEGRHDPARPDYGEIAMRKLRLGGWVGTALLAALAPGCGTGEPGAGFTNGPAPEIAPEKPAVRDDLPPPNQPDADVLAGRNPTSAEGAVGVIKSDTSGKGGAQGATSPAKPKTDGSAAIPKTGNEAARRHQGRHAQEPGTLGKNRSARGTLARPGASQGPRPRGHFEGAASPRAPRSTDRLRPSCKAAW
jgi:hypothetical protein